MVRRPLQQATGLGWELFKRIGQRIDTKRAECSCAQHAFGWVKFGLGVFELNAFGGGEKGPREIWALLFCAATERLPGGDAQRELGVVVRADDESVLGTSDGSEPDS